jgi:hypothetical protein
MATGASLEDGGMDTSRIYGRAPWCGRRAAHPFAILHGAVREMRGGPS